MAMNELRERAKADSSMPSGRSAGAGSVAGSATSTEVPESPADSVGLSLNLSPKQTDDLLVAKARNRSRKEPRFAGFVASAHGASMSAMVVPSATPLSVPLK